MAKKKTETSKRPYASAEQRQQMIDQFKESYKTKGISTTYNVGSKGNTKSYTAPNNASDNTKRRYATNEERESLKSDFLKSYKEDNDDSYRQKRLEQIRKTNSTYDANRRAIEMYKNGYTPKGAQSASVDNRYSRTPERNERANNVLSKASNWARDRLNENQMEYAGKDYSNLFSQDETQRRANRIAIDKIKSGQIGMEMVTGDSQTLKDIQKTASALEGRQLTEKETMDYITQRKDQLDVETYQDKQAESKKNYDELVKKEKFKDIARKGLEKTNEMPQQKISVKGETIPYDDIPVVFKNREQYDVFKAMNDDEKDTFGYLLETEGEDSAADYIEYASREVNARRSGQIYKEESDYAKDHPFIGTAKSVAVNMASGMGMIEAYKQGIENAITGEYKPIDVNSPAFDATTRNKALMEGSQRALDDWLAEKFDIGLTEEDQNKVAQYMMKGMSQEDALKQIGKDEMPKTSMANDVAKFLYQTGKSMLDSSTGRLLGRAYLPMMGLGAGSAMVQDVVNRGGNTRQAIATGTMAAAAEYVSENLGLDRMTEGFGQGAKARVDGSTVRKLLTNFFRQAVPEGLEEVVSDIVNETTDQIVMKDNSEYQNYIRSAMEDGKTEGQAISSYYFKKMGDVVLSFAGGFLSGGVMGTGAFAVGYVKGERVGKVLNSQPGMGNYLTALASKLEGYESAEMAKEIGNRELTNQQATDLYWQIDEDIKQAKKDGIDTDAIEREVQDQTKITEEAKNELRIAAEEDAQESVAKEEENVQNTEENVPQEVMSDQEYRQKLLETANKAVQAEEKREQVKKGPVELTGDEFHEGPSVFEKSGIKKGTNYKGSAAEITGINKVEDGKIYFDVDTGTTTEVVDAMDSDLSLDENLLKMVQSANDLGEAGKRNLLLEYKGENEGVDIDTYIKAFKQIYDGAALNLNKETLYKFTLDGISNAQRDAAYEAGRADAVNNAKEIIKRLNKNRVNATQGAKVTYATRQILSDNVKNYIQAMANISDANFVVVDTLSDGTKPGANGSYKNGTVTIALDSRKPLNALINHELTHHMVATTPFGQEFVEFVCKKIAESKKMSMEDLIERYADSYAKAGQNLSRLEIIEEIAADSTELFGTTENSQQIIDEMVKQNKGMAEKVHEFLTDFIKQLREIFSGIPASTAAARRLNENIEAAERAEKIFYEALFHAGKTHRNAVEANKGMKQGAETIETKSKFSMDVPVEMTKDLVAVHNINSSNLRKQLKLDGFPMPSIAVTKAELGHENFGDISFIFGRDTIDPKNKKNKVYAADAWTPTFPAIEYEGNDKVTNKLSDALWTARQNGMPSRFAADANNITSDPGYALKVYGGESGVIDRALENDGFKALYLDSIGKPVQVMTKEVRNEVEPVVKDRCQKIIDNYNIDELYHMNLNELFDKHGEDILRMILSKDAPLLQKLDENYDWQQSRMTKNLITNAIRKAYEFSQGTLEKTETVEDYQAEKKFIEDNLDQNGFEKWVKDNLKGIEKSKGIWNGKEIFTPSGNRRSFKQTHLEVNATNIVKAMLAQNDDVRNVAGFNGPKSIRAVVVDEFKSIADIKKNSNKLASISEAEFNAAQDELANRLSNVIGGIQSNKQIFDNAFIDIDNVGNGIMDAVRTSIDPARIKRTLEGYGRIVTMDQAEEIADICQTIKDMPVHMFEAKPLRVVSYDEIQKVIIPQTLESDLKDTLREMSDQHGFDVVEYDKTVEGDRKNKLNSMNDVKFSVEVGMSADEEYKELDGKEITVIKYKEGTTYLEGKDMEEFSKLPMSKAEKALREIMRILEIPDREFKSKDIDFSFGFLAGRAKEIIAKQAKIPASNGRIKVLKFIENVDQVISNAYLLTSHTDEEYREIYRPDHEINTDLERTYVLFSAYEDGEEIIPVKITVMTHKTGSGPRVHVANAFEGIKKAGIVGHEIQIGNQNPTPAVSYNISDLLHEVKTRAGYEDIGMYVPEKFAGDGESNTKEIDERRRLHDQERNSGKLSLEVDTEGRNTTVNNDIRYSLQDTADVDFDKLMEENRQQKEVIKHLNGVIESMTTYVPDQKQMRKVGQYILKKYNSNYKLKTFEENMTRIWDYVTNSKNVDPEMVASATANMAKMILQESTQVDRTLSDQYKDLTDKIRNTKITISEPMRGDLDRAGGYTQFMRDNFGKMRIGNGGRNVDSFYQELAAEYPEWFNADEVTNEADEMIRISEVLKMLQPQVTNIYGMNMDQAATDLAYDIYESIYNIGQKTTSKKWEKEAALYKQKRAELEQKYKEEYEANYQALKERSAMVDRSESDKILQVKAKYQSSLENRAARLRDADDRNRLLKALRRINKMNLTPENMKIVDSLVGDIDLVAKSMRGDTQYHLEALRDRYYQAMKDDPDFVPSPTIEEKIARLDKQKISDMGIEGVRTLLEAVLEFEHKIRTDKRQIDSDYKKTNYELATEIIGEFDSSKGVNLNSTGARALNKYVTMSSSAIREMRKMAGYALDSKWEMLGNQLNEGQLKMTKFQQDASKHFQEFVDKNEKWLKDIHGPKAERINIGQVDGKDVFITPAMRISLYLHSLNNANLRHIVGGTMLQDGELVKFEGGGIKVPDLDLLAKGNVNEAYANGTRVKLTKSGLKQILNGMTEREKQYANLAHTFFDEMCKTAINDTSVKLDGFEKALVNNYFPIRTDSNFTQTEFESIISDTSIEGMGMLKKRAGGTNPIMLEDVINVIERQTKSVSKYYGLAIPVRNFNKIYNVTEQGYTTSVKEALQKKWGTEGSMYMENLLADIQGSRANPHSFLDDLRGNYAGAVLTLNLSVTLKQAGSYPTAAAVVGWGPLAKALNPGVRVDQKIIDQYSPLLWYRNQGNATSELADMAKTKTWQNYFPKAIQKNVFNWIQNMDTATVKRLWLAAEYFVQDQGMKKGSEEYYQEVAKVYNRIIEETQPNYTTMQRPDILRNPNNAVKMLTMFKTQALQNFNIAADAIGEYQARSKMLKEGKITKEQMSASSKKLANAISSQIVAAAVIGAMVKAVDLIMHKRKKLEDEEGNLSWIQALKGAGQEMMSTMAGSFLGGSEIYNWIYKTITGEKYYGINASNMEALTDLSTDTQALAAELLKAMAGGSDSEKVTKKLNKAVNSLAKVTGLPIENAKKLFDAGNKWVQDIKLGELFGSDIEYSYDDLYEVMKANDKEMEEKIRQYLIDSGKTEKGIQNAISTLRNQEIKESDDFLEAVKVKKAGGNVDAYRDRIVREYEKYGATKQSIGTLITNAAKE